MSALRIYTTVENFINLFKRELKVSKMNLLFFLLYNSNCGWDFFMDLLLGGLHDLSQTFGPGL